MDAVAQLALFCLCPRAHSCSFQDNLESDHLAQKTLHFSV